MLAALPQIDFLVAWFTQKVVLNRLLLAAVFRHYFDPVISFPIILGGKT